MIRLLVALLSLGTLVATASPGSVSSDAAAVATAETYSLDQLIARRLVQHTLRFARPGPEADPQAGYRAAVGILEWAAELAPDDVEIHRRLAAAGAVLDSSLPMIIQAERNLLRLEPDNATAQLNVISRAIDERQSVTERLDLCERLLRSAAGARLMPEVLSHVAYRAAILAEEQGRASVASSYLEEALKRNPVNLDAAALNALETDRQTAKVELLVRAMMQLVKADPVNEAALNDLIAVVQESGFQRGAADLIEGLSAQAARHQSSIPDDLFADYAYLRCAESGPRDGLDLIKKRQDSFDRFERRRRQQEWIAQQQAALKKAADEGLPTPQIGEMPTFEDVSVDLSIHLQITRLLLAMAAESENDVESSLASLERIWDSQLQELKSTDRTSLPVSAINAMNADQRRIIADRAWTRLWVNRHVEQAAADVLELDRSGNHDPAELQRLRSWLSLRQGDAQAAIAGLQSLQAVDPLSDLGVATAQLELGRTADATRLLGEIYQGQPGKLVGILCKWKYEKLTGKPMPAPRQARAVEKELDRFPQTLSDLLMRPERYFSLSIAPRTERTEPLDAITFDVTVRNDGPWPVAIDAEKILPSRLAVFPIFQIGGKRLPTGTRPLTLDLERRLMLMPAEEMTVPISIDHTLFGLLIPNFALRPLSVQFQAMLDYDVGSDGRFRPQSWSIVRQSKPMQVSAWPGLLDGATPDLAGQLSAQDSATTVQTISKIGALLHARLTRMIDPAANPELMAAMDAGMNRLIELWPELDAKTAAWAILSLPFQKDTSTSRIAVLDQFEAVARRSTDPLVQMAWIAARSASDADVVLEASLRSDNPQLRAIAQDARAYFNTPDPLAPDPLQEETPEK